MAAGEPVLLAQLTDTHILDPAGDQEHWVDNNGRLAQAVASLNAEWPRPDLVVATGDLTNDARAAEVEELVRLLAPLELPLLPLPGNHDDRELLRDAFDAPWATDDGHLSWVVDVGPVRLVGLDTQVPGELGGLLDEEREAWLSATLAAEPDRPTVIAMHHPPFATGIAVMDGMRLEREEAFVAVVAANPQVGRILCGHVHRPIHTLVAGVAASVGPATVHHVALDLDPAGGVALVRDPAGYHLHRWLDGGWTTHLRYIDTGEVPFHPSWADGD